MESSVIKTFFDKVEKEMTCCNIPLNDYPTFNNLSNNIFEKVSTLIESLKILERYVDSKSLYEIINRVWSFSINNKDEFFSSLKELKLQRFIKSEDDGDIGKLADVITKKTKEKEESLKEIKDCYNRCISNVEDVYRIVYHSWLLLKTMDGINFTIDSPSIRQVYNWSVLIPNTDIDYKLHDQRCNDSNELYEQISHCLKDDADDETNAVPILVVLVLTLYSIYVTMVDMNGKWLNLAQIIICFAMILATCVFIFFQEKKIKLKQCDAKNKLKEKIINEAIDIYREDTEYRRLRTKMEISLHDKLGKARIDEWCRNKEQERKIAIKGQERLSEFGNVLVELAKTKNIVTLKDPRNNGRTVTIERSILSDDCCEELKDIINNHISQSDDCCDKIKDVLKCLFGDSIDCEKVINALKCVFCGDGNNKRNDELVDKIDRLITLLQSKGASGVQQVVNIGGNENSSSEKKPIENKINN